MAYRVMGERIVIRPDETPREIGRIALPESVGLVPTTGTIIQIGPEVAHYEVGMKLAFATRAGTLARIGEEEVRILTPDEVLCILPEEVTA